MWNCDYYFFFDRNFNSEKNILWVEVFSEPAYFGLKDVKESSAGWFSGPEKNIFFWKLYKYNLLIIIH